VPVEMAQLILKTFVETCAHC